MSSPTLRKFATPSPQITELRSHAAALFQAGQYEQAAAVYMESYRQALEEGVPDLAARSLNSSGAARLARFDYAEARRAFLEARRLAQRLEDWDLAAAVSVNLASLELQVGNLEAGRVEAQRALAALERSPRPKHRAEALALAAKIDSAERGIEAARPLFQAALDAADRDGDTALRARLWGQLGYEYLGQNRLAEAEAAIVEAFRLRRLTGDRELAQSYRALGLLRLAQGELGAAAGFLDRALAEGRRSPGRVPLWATYYARGNLYAARGEPARSLSEFRAALEDARRWRLRIPPTNSGRVSAEAGLDNVCGAFIETAAGQYLATGRRALLSEAFEAAEDCRAAGLCARLGEPWRAGWKSGELLERVRQALPPSAALFSFHLAEPRSYGWVVTREGVALRPLAGRGRLLDLAAEFRQAVASGSSGSGRLGAALYAELFGPARQAAGKRQWLIAAVPDLTELPFAALVTASSGGQFLVEQHTLELVASVPLSWVEDIARPRRGARFVGIADPIYNAADPRLPPEARLEGEKALPRLAGSSDEVRACARAWGAPALLLEGRSASRHGLREALEAAPAIIHFATHVVRPADPPARAAIALSLTPGGRPELLTPEEIATWTVPASSVVALSGCASGAPERRPRSYSLSVSAGGRSDPAARTQAALARAWLAAGASAVAVSLWPTPDDTGELFVAFYRGLAGGLDAPGALRAAQLEALRSGSWRSAPSFWAAYFVIGRG